jgi:hypothetical protein
MAVMPLAVLGQLSATGCSCGDLNCGPASVAVHIGQRSASAARICINEVCENASDSDWRPAGWAELYFDAVPITVRDDEDFALTIAVLDADGTELATTAETRNFDVDECHCVSFEYRWDGTKIDRTL